MKELNHEVAAAVAAVEAAIEHDAPQDEVDKLYAAFLKAEQERDAEATRVSERHDWRRMGDVPNSTFPQDIGSLVECAKCGARYIQYADGRTAQVKRFSLKCPK